MLEASWNPRRWCAPLLLTVSLTHGVQSASAQSDNTMKFPDHPLQISPESPCTQPIGAGVRSDPWPGKSEGWPAVGAEAIVSVKNRRIRCVATDAPDLGGVDPRRALMTYWALGSREMVGVEFLHNVGKVQPDGYFLFAALKIHNCHGGPGRAIVLE